MAPATMAPAKAEPKAMSDTENQALERPADRTPPIILTPEDYRSSLLRWQQQKFHILTPFANISGLAPGHGIITAVIQISLDKEEDEIYDGLPFLKPTEVALAKNGLRRIREGLGISTRLEYVSLGVIRHYWVVKAIASYDGVDGAPVFREAGEEWDLRDGSERLKGWTANQINEGRKHGLRNCETRAINAVIKECGCGLKQAYTRDELRHPFVATRVMFLPDTKDPEIKRMVTARKLDATSVLYAATGRQELPPADNMAGSDSGAANARPVGSGSTAHAPAPAKSADPAADLPPVEGAVRIMKVDTKTGEKNGRKWTRFSIVDSNGVDHSTFDKSIADYAEKARAENKWVEITEEQDGQYRNLVEIAPAGQQPSLLPDTDKL